MRALTEGTSAASGISRSRVGNAGAGQWCRLGRLAMRKRVTSNEREEETVRAKELAGGIVAATLGIATALESLAGARLGIDERLFRSELLLRRVP